MNVVMTPQRKKTYPKPQASYGPKVSYRQRSHLSRTNANAFQVNHTQAYEYERVSSNRHVHKTQNYSAYSYEYYIPTTRLFARYIGTNYRNGPPMKKVWVPKRLLENLPVNAVMTPQVKKTNPRPQASYGPKASYRQRTHLSHTNANVLQGSHTQAYEYERVSSNRHVHKTKNYSAYSYE